jgi:hypothetical protein
MNRDELTSVVATFRLRLERIQLKMDVMKQQMEAIDVPKYRAAGIFDQFVLQIQQALSASDLYTSLEAELSDTHLVWE